MPIRELYALSHEFPMASKGINLWKSLPELEPNESPYMKNCIYRNGIAKRNGSAVHIATEVVTGKRIVGLHRFYYGASSSKLVAVSDTIQKYWDGAAWQNIRTGLTSDKPTNISPWLQSIYFANSTDTGNKWDGTTSTTLTGGGYTNPPQAPIQFLGYADRLLVIENTNSGASVFGALRWSDSYSDTTWSTAAACNVKPDSYLYGMCIHSSTNVSNGYSSKVLLAGANGMYLFSGTNLATSGGNYTIEKLGLPVGCNAPKTMVWTPKGTMWLGIDRQVYLLPFDTSTPIPIGRKITSNYDFLTQGVEDMPSTLTSGCCATYHRGYYILSVPSQYGTYNNTQWWLDVNHLYSDGEYGPWFGPMTGQSINCFATQDGTGDTGELLGGEANSATGSYIYECNKRGVHSDNGTAIDVVYRTFYNPLNDISVLKNVAFIESEILDTSSDVNVSLNDIEGSLTQPTRFNLSTNSYYWSSMYWGEQYWNNTKPIRVQAEINPLIQCRRLAIQLEHNSSSDKFELYGLRVNALEQEKVYDERA